MIDVEVNLTPFELGGYNVARRTPPFPYRTRGIVDTAAEQSCIRLGIAETLSLAPVDHARLRTALKEDRVGVYYVTLLLAWQQKQPPDPIPVRALAPPEVLGAEVLIGLDVLRFGEFVLFGPDSRFELLLPRDPGSDA